MSHSIYLPGITRRASAFCIFPLKGTRDGHSPTSLVTYWLDEQLYGITSWPWQSQLTELLGHTAQLLWHHSHNGLQLQLSRGWELLLVSWRIPGGHSSSHFTWDTAAGTLWDV